MTKTKRIFLASRRGVLAGGMVLAAGVRARAADPVVETASGKVRGRMDGGVMNFRNIPYGASTAGANRFLPPQPPAKWAGIREATSFGPSAPQFPSTGGALDSWYTTIEPISEECLHLNVWTADTSARRPVMVWLHGGGWTACAATAPGFNGARLASEGGVVLVSINHRLDLFGFINLGNDDARFAQAGVAGVVDMVAALQWVHDNIAAFGGDPGNVTIFGQSGGAAKVTAMMAVPAARGLFHKAIAESCSGGLKLDGQEESAAQTHALAQALGVAPTGAALQAVPMDKLIAAMRSVADPFRPVLDGHVFPRNPFDPAAPESGHDVPLMIGNAATEATLFMSGDMANFTLAEPEVARRVARYLHIDAAATQRLLDAYRTEMPGATPSELLAQIGTDYMYRRNTTRVAELQSSRAAAPVYAYVYDWKTPVLNGVLHSPHTIEVPFVFGTTAAARGLLGDGPELAGLTRMTMQRWTSFARTGTPEAEGEPDWPRFDTTSRQTMMLSVQSRVEQNPGGKARAALADLPMYEYSIPANYVRA